MESFSIGDTVSMRRNGNSIGAGYYIKPICIDGFITNNRVFHRNQVIYQILVNKGETHHIDTRYKYEAELYTCRLVLTEKIKFKIKEEMR